MSDESGREHWVPEHVFLIFRVGEWPLRAAGNETTAIASAKALLDEKPSIYEQQRVRILKIPISEWEDLELRSQVVHESLIPRIRTESPS